MPNKFAAPLRFAAALAVCALALTSAGPSVAAEPQLALLKPKLAEMRPGERRALRLVIENGGQADDRLLSVSSIYFGQSVLVDRQGALLEGLTVPAGEARTLAPEGDAVLVLGAPSEDWIEGSNAILEFTFERAGKIELPVRAGPRPSGGLKLTTAERTIEPMKAEKEGGEREYLEGAKKDE